MSLYLGIKFSLIHIALAVLNLNEFKTFEESSGITKFKHPSDSLAFHFLCSSFPSRYGTLYFSVPSFCF